MERYRATRVPGDDGRAGDIHAMVEVVISGMVRPDPTRLNLGAPEKEVLEAGRTIWRRIVEIADSHNDPGRFTTLNGFEWTPTPGGVNLHRVIIFRGNDVPDLPLSNYEASHPEQLWDWLETAAGGPGQCGGDHPQRELQQRPDVQPPLQRRPGNRRGLRPAPGTVGAAGGDVPEQGLVGDDAGPVAP